MESFIISTFFEALSINILRIVQLNPDILFKQNFSSFVCLSVDFKWQNDAKKP